MRAKYADDDQREPSGRQPVHTVYGGAHLFKSDTLPKLRDLALRSLDTFAPDSADLAEVFELENDLAAVIYPRIRHKIEVEAIEDYRLDFEDGYGVRPDEEEDAHAAIAAREVAAAAAIGALPPLIGIRIKPFSAESHLRSIRTLDLFLTTLINGENCALPVNFVVTLPKVVFAHQITVLCDVLDEIEAKLELPAGAIKIEIMIETPQSIFTPDGKVAIPDLVRAARGRCTSLHFGAYDYTASCGITAADQDLLHPACDFARNMMQISLAGTGIGMADGATNVIPVGPHRGTDLSDKQRQQNRAVVHRGWKLHFNHCRHSLSNGFFQGWDLHPAQIPSRYAAVYSFFHEGFAETSDRLKRFLDNAARATLVGALFDDAATGQGLLNYFLRALSCGAVTDEEVFASTGLTKSELDTGSFAAILKSKSSAAGPTD